MRHIIALAATAVLLTAGCASSQSGSLGPAPTLAPVEPAWTPRLGERL